MRLVFLMISLIIASCGVIDQKESVEPTDTDTLWDMYEQKTKRALELRDSQTGWLAGDDCDGMIWAGKYGSALGIDGVDIFAASFDDEPGRFGRRPLYEDGEYQGRCWSEEGDTGSSTTWSRDMGSAGLLPYCWVNKRLDILQLHADYGRALNWVMGQPIGDGRVIYTPNVIGLLYELIYALGGQNSANRLWPSYWPGGLDDYEAHIQSMMIWLQGEAAATIGDMDAVPRQGARLTGISGTMFDRLEEHYSREPESPWYTYLYHLYSDGDMGPVTKMLIDHPYRHATYVRCSSQEECVLAEWLFVASRVLERSKDDRYHNTGSD